MAKTTQYKPQTSEELASASRGYEKRIREDEERIKLRDKIASEKKRLKSLESELHPTIFSRLNQTLKKLHEENEAKRRLARRHHKTRHSRRKIKDVM
jgi:dephospho-CoA kinase